MGNISRKFGEFFAQFYAPQGKTDLIGPLSLCAFVLTSNDLFLL